MSNLRNNNYSSYNRYQYETSPRKLEPNYKPQQNPYKKKKTTAIKPIKKQVSKKQLELQKKKKRKMIYMLVVAFAVMMAISYRNSQIGENFAEIQDLKEQLATVEKENTQLEIGIENSLNLENLEKEAREQLGMQKLTNRQTIYVQLPKDDYIVNATEEVIIEEEGFFTRIFNDIQNIFK